MAQHKKGDTVHVTRRDSPKYAGTYTVEKVNPKTYKLVREGDGMRLTASHELVQAGRLEDQTSISLIPVEPVQHFLTGTVVSIDLPQLRGNLWVVTGEVARGYRVFPLGGSRGYYTGIAAEKMTEVTEITDWKKA